MQGLIKNFNMTKQPKMIVNHTKQPKMIVMCGLPGSGKNFWIKTNKSLKNYTVVELDWIRKEIFGHQFHQNAEQFIIGMGKSFARMLCSQGKNIIINSTALTTGIRNDWVNLAKEYNYHTTIVFVDTPIQTCYTRNNKRKDNKVPDEVINRMLTIFKYPKTIHNVTGYDNADQIRIIKC
jgi:predicted kinase